ncbi:endonuclease domain-containing protein [Dyadobacter crusticola]|uniref:endonuclease domain-containing protein n=1 Tax=Dyadobacter crusticola TaxID=292407 RepID=UPI00068C7E22|nr:endonuclease domain-containing protein [Dyadobacter crusticola]
MPMHHGAGPITFARARQLRNAETRAEKLLWERLSNKKLGVKFRRQHPISNFIVDFYCHEKKLVIEVDGSIHLLADNIEYDKIRSDVIVEFGVSIIRFTNEDIYFRMENVIALIKQVISESK